MADSDSPFQPYHLWLARLLLLVAVGFTLYGFLELWQAWQLVHHGSHGQAVVADYKVYPASGKSPTMYQPILRFVDPAGKTWQKDDSESNQRRLYGIGQTIEVIYPSGDPGKFVFNTWDDVWAVGVITVVGGMIVSPMLYGLLVFVRIALDRPAFGAEWAWIDRYLLPLRIALRAFGR